MCLNKWKFVAKLDKFLLKTYKSIVILRYNLHFQYQLVLRAFLV